MAYPRHSDNAGRRLNSTESIHKAAVKLATESSPTAAAKLGSRTTEAKAEAAQENGKLGGRPVGS